MFNPLLPLEATAMAETTPPQLAPDTIAAMQKAASAVQTMSAAGVVLQKADTDYANAMASVDPFHAALNDAQAKFNLTAKELRISGILLAKLVLRDTQVACPCLLSAVLLDGQDGQSEPLVHG